MGESNAHTVRTSLSASHPGTARTSPCAACPSCGLLDLQGGSQAGTTAATAATAAHTRHLAGATGNHLGDVLATQVSAEVRLQQSGLGVQLSLLAHCPALCGLHLLVRLVQIVLNTADDILETAELV